jgi:hypothetical protein
MVISSLIFKPDNHKSLCRDAQMPGSAGFHNVGRLRSKEAAAPHTPLTRRLANVRVSARQRRVSEANPLARSL